MKAPNITSTYNSNPGNPHSAGNIPPLLIPSLVAATGEDVRFVHLANQKKVAAYIISPASHGHDNHDKEVLRLVRNEDLPKELRAINDPVTLKSFLANAYVKVVTLDNGDIKLYVEQRGLGGGREDRNLGSWSKLLSGIRELAAERAELSDASSTSRAETKPLKAFISYAWERGDKNSVLQRFLEGLRDDLEKLGIETFFDVTRMSGNMDHTMQENLAQSDIILPILTPLFESKVLLPDDPKQKNNLKFEYNLTLEKAQNNPDTLIIPLRYEKGAANALRTEMEKFSPIDCTDPETRTESFIAGGEKNLVH